MGPLLLATLALLADPVLNGEASRTCAPWDGPATRVTLAGADGTRVHVALYRAPAALSGARLSGPYTTNEWIGDVTRCPARDVCERASAWNVRLDRFTPAEGRHVRGTVDATFAAGKVRFRFDAVWTPNEELCG